MSESMMEWSIRDSREQIAPGSIMMDGWKLKKLLGKGSFGDVWLAEKTMFGITEQSAIKIIRIPHNPEDIDAMRAEGFSEDVIRTELRRNVENAVREIRAMLDLQNHPAVVSYKSFEVVQYEEDETWEIDIRMQLLTPLADWITAKGVTAEDVIRMGISLSDLLTAFEKENILHRDIKPANIFVDKMNNFKLGDFGLARAVSDSNSVHSKGVGTEAFMAPEVFTGGQYDHRADIYSLGLVMYWLLNSQSLPFANKSTSRSEAIAKRLTGERIPALTGVDPALDRIIRKACEADPKERWKNAKEFRDALVGLGAGMNESNSPKPSKKHILFAVIAALIAALVCALAIYIYAFVLLANRPATGGDITSPNKTAVTGPASAIITENSAETPASLFTITWQDDAGNTIDTTSVAYGTEPSHDVPEKEADQQYTYTFSGWEPAVENVTGDATYKATFKKNPISTPTPAVGSVIKFGHYEQDTDTSNGQEEIEWIVLDNNNGNALLLSRYGLDAKPYNRSRTDITWEACTLRTWLNSDFLNSAFNAEEKTAILTTAVDDNASQQYAEGDEGGYTTGENSIQDSIFLLSYAEANKYLGVQDYLTPGAGDHIAPMASTAPTAYAINNGAANLTANDGTSFAFWWLRSPGSYRNRAIIVGNDGCLSCYVDERLWMVRPAMWVDLKEL